MITLVFILTLCCVFVFYVLWKCHILYVLYIDSILTEVLSVKIISRKFIL